LSRACEDSFNTLEEAKSNLCYFDNSKPIEKVININNKVKINTIEDRLKAI